MIKAYFQENIKVLDIANSLGRSKQTIYNVINYLKEGHSAYDYYKRYKVNKNRCGKNKTSLSQAEKNFIQTHLEVEAGALISLTELIQIGFLILWELSID